MNMIGVGHSLQRISGVSRLTPGLALSTLAQAFGIGFLEAVTGGRLIAVTTVLLQLSLQRSDSLLQPFHLLLNSFGLLPEAFFLLLQHQNVLHQGLKVVASQSNQFVAGQQGAAPVLANTVGSLEPASPVNLAKRT